MRGYRLRAPAVRAITGEVPFRGHLPINLPGLYKIGDGITDR